MYLILNNLDALEGLRKQQQEIKGNIREEMEEAPLENVGLFEYSLLSGAECGWNTLLCTRDLHNSEYAEGNVMTEYEQKFSQMGNPICKAVFTRKK